MKHCDCTHKARSPEWEAAQAIEEPAVQALLPAFRRFRRVLTKYLDQLLADLDANPEADVLGRLRDLPWGEAAAELVQPWEKQSFRVFLDAANLALTTSAKAFEGEDAVTLASQFALEHALDLAEVTSIGSEQGVILVLQDIIEQGRNSRAGIKRIKDMIGLTARDAQASINLRNKLLAQGLPQTAVERQVKKWVNKALRNRAETIARTEINRARNMGNLSVWQSQEDEGDLAPNPQKEWLSNPGCRLCATIAENGPVPLKEPFIHPDTNEPLMSPPAHPRCRCTVTLVFPDF